jgi:hypothetical protein
LIDEIYNVVEPAAGAGARPLLRQPHATGTIFDQHSASKGHMLVIRLTPGPVFKCLTL